MTVYMYQVAVAVGDDSPTATVAIASESGDIGPVLQVSVGRDEQAGGCDIGNAILTAVANEHYGA